MHLLTSITVSQTSCSKSLSLINFALAPKQTVSKPPTKTEKYRKRDAHAAFFHPNLKMTQKKTKPKLKRKPKPLTNKQRQQFARQHYELNHGNKSNDNNTSICFTPQRIHGHHACNHCEHTSKQLDSTLPITPATFNEMWDYQQNISKNRSILHNLSTQPQDLSFPISKSTAL